jgi:hypothetical protein
MPRQNCQALKVIRADRESLDAEDFGLLGDGQTGISAGLNALRDVIRASAARVRVVEIDHAPELTGAVAGPVRHRRVEVPTAARGD